MVPAMPRPSSGRGSDAASLASSRRERLRTVSVSSKQYGFDSQVSGNKEEFNTKGYMTELGGRHEWKSKR